MPSIFSPIPALDVELVSTLSRRSLIFSGCGKTDKDFVRAEHSKDVTAYHVLHSRVEAQLHHRPCQVCWWTAKTTQPSNAEQCSASVSTSPAVEERKLHT